MKTNQHTQRGDIAVTLTVLAVIIMTIGALIGSTIVTTQQSTRQAEAQGAPTAVPNQGNIDASQIEISFGPIVERNQNQNMMSGNICFKPASNNPPGNGIYQFKAYARVAGQVVEVGSSLDYKILTQRSAFICPTQKPYNIFFYRNLNNVPGVPAGSTLSDVEYVHIYVETNAGSWSPNMVNQIADISNPASIFDQTPGPLPTQAPTNTPAPTSTPAPTAVPTAAPTPQPGTGNLNVHAKIVNPQDMGSDFSNISFQGELCSIDANGNDGLCGPLAQYPTPLRFTVDRANPNPSEDTQTFNLSTGTVRVYMYFDYNKPGGTRDNSGITVAHGSSICPNKRIDSEKVGCDIDVTGTQTKDVRFEFTVPTSGGGTQPTPQATPQPTTPPQSTPTPGPQGSIISKIYAVWNNSSQYPIVKLLAEVCINSDSECKTESEDVNLPPRARGLWYVDFQFNSNQILDHRTKRTCATYKVSANGTVDICHTASTTQLGNESNIDYVNADENEVNVTTKEVSEAADVSGDSCVNSNDAALLVQKLGLPASSTSQCDPEDILCDGFVNALDLSLLIENLNQGFGCVYNQPE